MARVKQKNSQTWAPREGDLGPYDGMKVVILDRGAVELAYPHDWSLEPDPQGYMHLEDVEERCILELSYLQLPPLPPGFPTLAERLREVLVKREDNLPRRYQFLHHEDPYTLEIHEETRPDMDLAWCDYTFDAPDRALDGAVRLAHGRWLLGANDYVQTLWTFYYWEESADWAVSWWRRMLETLQLGRHLPPNDPQDHWMLRDPD